ncbi:E3 ubiquitin ligase PQT3-like isoform X2 [Dioscorea cayenensis subsp. rotundata]|uniref:E3 ubiquitin ligase PQT3-like isoform X2 n=1 Tax=Dioscorea cayennensis subsp. rotundata TaxID=55577 RepID=A0AB40CQK1_DIOCR|nr:E3 ubiquitin ligase PQT3-like isoform X2 [Dioscorea cayenensis subsp. rotundata]
MAIKCRFKSEIDYFVIPIEGASISVRELKDSIIKFKRLDRGKDFDVVLTNVQSNEDYDDEAALISRHMAVIVRRVPGLPRMPIVPNHVEEAHGHARGCEHDVQGPMMANHGFGHLETPPQGYVCHRCGVAGHFIHHCPTNGDPEFDNKRFTPQFRNLSPMPMSTSNGSCVLQSGVVSARPDEATHLKESGSLSSSRSVSGLPPELHCPLCKEVMKDAVFTSNCCFNSFCDKCIREHIISNLTCMCGSTNILVDSLVPNKTLRDTINRMLESASHSSGDSKSVVQDPSSVCDVQQAPPTISLPISSEDENREIFMEDVPDVKEKDNHCMLNAAVQNLEDAVKKSNVSDVTAEDVNVKETTAKENAAMTEQIHGIMLNAGQGEKKKKKGETKILQPGNAASMQWSYPAMPSDPSSHYQYWGNDALPWEMNHFVQAFSGVTPYMDYQQFQHQYSFGAQGYKLPYGPYLPQRDISELPMNKKAINQEQPVNSADNADMVEPRNSLHDKGLSSLVQTERDYFSRKPARMAWQVLSRERKHHSPHRSPHRRQIDCQSNHSAHPYNDHAEELNKRKSSAHSHILVTDSERPNWSNKKRKYQTH